MPKGADSVIDAIRRRSAFADVAMTLPVASGHGVVLSPQKPKVMLNLRGTPDAAFIAAVLNVSGCQLPTAQNSSYACPEGKLLKLGPTEWLMIAESATVWSVNMTIPGGTLTDVSHARIAVHISGEKSRDMLAKGCAIDLHPRRFPPGTCIQTGIAKINVILHRPQEDDGFILYAARSYAGSFWHWLADAANEYGYHVIQTSSGSDKFHG